MRHSFSSESSWQPKTQPNDSRAAVWSSFWFSTRFTWKTLDYSNGSYLYSKILYQHLLKTKLSTKNFGVQLDLQFKNLPSNTLNHKICHHYILTNALMMTSMILINDHLPNAELNAKKYTKRTTLSGRLVQFFQVTRFTPLDGTLIFDWIEWHTKNTTKQPLKCRLVEFLLSNPAFGRYSN